MNAEEPPAVRSWSACDDVSQTEVIVSDDGVRLRIADEAVQRHIRFDVTLAEYVTDFVPEDGEPIRTILSRCFYPSELAEIEAFIEERLQLNPALRKVVPRPRKKPSGGDTVLEPKRPPDPAGKRNAIIYTVVVVALGLWVGYSYTHRDSAGKASSPRAKPAGSANPFDYSEIMKALATPANTSAPSQPATNRNR